VRELAAALLVLTPNFTRCGSLALSCDERAFFGALCQPSSLRFAEWDIAHPTAH